MVIFVVGCNQRTPARPQPKPKPVLAPTQNVSTKPIRLNLDLKSARPESWMRQEAEQKARRHVGHLWFSAALMDQSNPKRAQDARAMLQAWTRANPLKKGSWRYEVHEQQATSKRPCWDPKLRMWLGFAGRSEGGPGRCELFHTGVEQAEATHYVVVKTPLFGLSQEYKNPESIGMPLGDGRFVFFIMPLAFGGLNIDRLRLGMEQGFSEYHETLVAFPSISMKLKTPMQEVHHACPSMNSLNIWQDGLDVGDGETEMPDFDDRIFALKPEQARKAWIVDQPFEFALLDRQLQLILITGAYYNSNGQSGCSQVGASWEIGLDPKERTRLGQTFKNHSFKDFLRERTP